MRDGAGNSGGTTGFHTASGLIGVAFMALFVFATPGDVNVLGGLAASTPSNPAGNSNGASDRNTCNKWV